MAKKMTDQERLDRMDWLRTLLARLMSGQDEPKEPE